jgi:aminoglycoside phosphotransferase (APT) family kinase protein
MTLQHESTRPIPDGPQPGLARALRLAVREIESTLAQELQTDRARTTAGMLSQMLRHLALRATEQQGITDEWTERQSALLGEAGVALPDLPKDAANRHRKVTEALARVVAQRAALRTDPSTTECLDEWSRRVVAAEQAHEQALLKSVAEVPPITHSSERDALLDVTPERLQRYLAANLPQRRDVRVGNVTKLLSGFSKETFLIDVELDGHPEPMVMRRDIALGPVAGTVADEVPILRALHAQGLPVPEVVLVESDRSKFGEAFSLTRRAAGETAFSNVRGLSVGSGLEPAARALAEILGKLHSVDVDTLGLPARFSGPGLTMSEAVLREIAFYEKSWLRRAHQPSPTMAAVFAWLRANVPPSAGRTALVHGDAGLHNLMMHEGRPSAMLDWELCHVGDPAEDLAYCRTWIDQVLPWEDFLQVYYAHGGRPYRAECERFYGILANLRVVVFAAQAAYGSHWSEHPELTLMFASFHYHSVFVDKVGAQLLKP